jgi:hypothetical protein
MNHTLAVAARELRERWILFPAAFAIGCIPLVLPAFGARRDDAAMIGFGSAFLLGAAAAVVIGSSMLARDAFTGRLGFLFSRPVSWRAIWAGKWLASLVLVFGSALLAAIPWATFFPPSGAHDGSWLRAVQDGPGWSMVLALTVLAVGLANFNATAFRSRSPWLAVDLLLLMAAAWATREYLAPLSWYGFFDGRWTPQVFAAAIGLALLVGSAFQVAVGRSDIRRAHRFLSLGAWAVLWVALASAAGLVFWVRAAGPRDLSAFAVTRDPGGRWIFVEGRARTRGWYAVGYLIDSQTGRYLREPELRYAGRVPTGMLFSADGRVAARPGWDSRQRGTALVVFDLAAPAPSPRTVALENSPPAEGWWRSAYALSPDGRLVFYAHPSGVSLYDLSSGRRVATATLQPGFRPVAARFTGAAGARAWLAPADEAGGSAQAEMRVIDLAADGSTTARSFATAVRLGLAGAGPVVPDADGRRIVTLDDGLRLRDGADGSPIATLAAGNGTSAPRVAAMLAATFLADGRIVTADGAQPGAQHPRLAVFDRTGARLGEALAPLPLVGLGLGPETAPGRVVVSSHRTPVFFEDSLVFDANELRVAGRLENLSPAVGFFTAPAVPAGAPVSAVQLFRDREGRVLRVDTATGERRIVAGAGAPQGERLPWR